MKTRPYHKLQPNKSTSRPTHVIFVDTETCDTPISTTERKLDLKLGWACYIRYNQKRQIRKQEWLRFTGARAFWEFVESHIYSNIKLYIVGHNVAFDFRILGGFAHVEKNNWQPRFIWDKGKVTILTYRVNKATVQIISSTNFFGISLRKLGDLVGLPKLDVNFDATTDKELSTYCRRDVEILIKVWEIWTEFLDAHDLGAFRNTLASQAFAAYRHRFMPFEIMIHNNPTVCELERDAYKGGRSECFKVGEFPTAQYFYLDVNSMYVHQMNTKKYPTKLVGHRVKPGVALLKNKLRNYAVIARVIIDTKHPAFPVVYNKVNVYPVGIFETVLTTPELEFALKHCEVLEVKEMAWYKQDLIFRDYTDYFSHLKESYELAYNPAFRTVAKLFGNALYGKFGQRDEKLATEGKPNPNATLMGTRKAKADDRHKGGIIRHYLTKLGIFNHDIKQWTRPPGWKEPDFKRAKAEESFNSFPAIPAHVTAYARLQLWNLMCCASRENVFCCDTDSLIVNQQGYENLFPVLDDHAAGYLKVEHSAPNLTINAPKDYILGDRIRTKGIRKDAVEVSNGVFEQEQFLGTRGAKRRGEPDLVTIKKITKHLTRKIKSGTVRPDGWITPFQFPLEEVT